MRTTINIDDDILSFARSISKGKDTNVGAVVSDLARQGILNGAAHRALGIESESTLQQKLRDLGVVPFARIPEMPMVTDELVRQICENEGI